MNANTMDEGPQQVEPSRPNRDATRGSSLHLLYRGKSQKFIDDPRAIRSDGDGLRTVSA